MKSPHKPSNDTPVAADTTGTEQFQRPSYWDTAPAPEPQPIGELDNPMDPVRYGDWVKKGIAIDF